MSELKLLVEMKEKAKRKKKKIILPESHDERVLKAAEILTKEEIAEVVVIGNEEELKNSASKLGVDLSGVEIINPVTSDLTDGFAETFYNARKHKGVTLEAAKEQMKKDLFFGAMMVREGKVDGSVAGSTASTGDVLKAAFQCVGMPEGMSIVSSLFLMVFPDKTYSYADCAVVPNPDAAQLADIAISTADNHKKLTGEEPYVAMLSFSTMGSAKHENIDKVIEATKIAKAKRPDLNIDGEMQFDAATIESIGKRKAPNSSVAGRANVLVFPNLDAGNISYKITERLGGAEAVGPIVQGLKKPLFDLSRGCSVDDIVNTSIIASLMAN
jgi:phosphate acetyltransferase